MEWKSIKPKKFAALSIAIAIAIAGGCTVLLAAVLNLLTILWKGQPLLIP